MFEGKAYVYILTNNTHTVLYTGVTTDIDRRIHQHKQKVYPKSFTSKYQCSKLIFFYEFDNLGEVIETEKKLKKRNREKKRSLIERYNPNRVDLFEKGDPSTRNLVDSRLASGGHNYDCHPDGAWESVWWANGGNSIKMTDGCQ